MSAGMRRTGRIAAAILTMGLTGTATGAHIDWVCLGMAKPKPTGPSNNCFGYFPTIWRSWPAECQPCSTAYPVAATSPAPAPLPPPVETPAPKPVVETPPPNPAARTKPKITHPLIVPVSQALPVPAPIQTQPTPSTPKTKLPDPSDSGWTPVPPAAKTKK